MDNDTVVISDTTAQIIAVTKILDAVVKDKDEDRSTKYHARQAANSLRMLIASKVMG